MKERKKKRRRKVSRLESRLVFQDRLSYSSGQNCKLKLKILSIRGENLTQPDIDLTWSNHINDLTHAFINY